VTLLAFAADRRAAAAPLLQLSAGRAAFDQYFLPTAANPPHADAAVDRWDRRTDTVPLHTSCCLASSANNSLQQNTEI